MRIGILALQGDFFEHAAILRGLDADRFAPIEAVEIRTTRQLSEVDGLIIPGGESTTIGKLMHDCGLLDPLRERITAGMPTFGTCAGAIVLARDIGGLTQPLIGIMDLSIRRNAFGRQLESFEIFLPIPVLGDPPMRAVFIRAPAIVSVAAGVEVLARLPDGTIVAARQGHMLVAAFHPELTEDSRLHRYFVELVHGHVLASAVNQTTVR
ncbi:MAG: pyridoxal 5'-phosphate synthase glutaminase subunit PdxT [Spirochaetia bacterium]|jgi:5'-phosphate synthase pdxT subunit